LALWLFSAAALAVTDDIFIWLKWAGVIRYEDQQAVPSSTQLGIGYRLYRSTDGENWELFADIAPNGVNIVEPQWRGDVTVDFDAINKVRVTAYLGAEETGPSNEVIVPLPSLESPQNADLPITIYLQD
jgi:hypothetical protein